MTQMHRRAGSGSPRPRGEDARAAKLTEAEVREIKAAPRSGRFRVTNARLALRYGVSDVSIGRIRKGVTWAHVED